MILLIATYFISGVIFFNIIMLIIVSIFYIIKICINYIMDKKCENYYNKKYETR